LTGHYLRREAIDDRRSTRCELTFQDISLRTSLG